MALVVFVCTGNICRSPMAEGIAAARLDPGHRVEFASVGTHAVVGAPATRHAITAAEEVGADISYHRGRDVYAGLLTRADRIYVMTRGHQRRITTAFPGVAEKVELLDPEGTDIADPYGMDLPDYREARDRIVAAVEARLPDWERLASPDGSGDAE